MKQLACIIHPFSYTGVMIEAPELLNPMSEFHVRVKGQVFVDLPKDLYIPPDALEVFLDAFEGPLDLLLYLIRRHNLDILDIPIAQVTAQYLKYVDVMQTFQLELAGEYLVMAAMLAEIKSRMLLPRSAEAEEEEMDPRAELVRRLQLYEQFKQAAHDLDDLPRLDRDTFTAVAEMPEFSAQKQHPPVALQELLLALSDVLKRVDVNSQHHIQFETLTVREAMAFVLDAVNPEDFTPFEALFRPDTGRLGVIVTFLALLELLRESMIELVQAEPFGPIHVRAIAC
jgi:segregation and condensation protein A